MLICECFVRFFLIGAILTACASAGCLGGEDEENGQYVSGTGTIILVPHLGGLFGIVGDDGKEYLPLNLDDQYKIHGQRVRFFARVRGEQAPLHQWGIPIEIIEIEFIPED
jgi:hypothetical protein